MLYLVDMLVMDPNILRDSILYPTLFPYTFCALACRLDLTWPKANKVGQHDLDDPVVQFYSRVLHAWLTKWCGTCMQKALVKLANNIVMMV